MKPRSLPFRLTALAITVSMLTSPGMAVMPTVWQIGGPPCCGYGYPRPYLNMGPFPPLPLPRWYAPPAPWAYQPVPYTASYAPYASGACCGAPVSYVGSTGCSGCATGCSSCGNGCSAFSGYPIVSGGVAMDACCGGVPVQPASSTRTIDPEADPDADAKFRGLGNGSGNENSPGTNTSDGFSGAGGAADPNEAAPGADETNNSGGTFRDYEFGNEPAGAAPSRSGVPRPSGAGLGAGGFGGGGADTSGLGGSNPANTGNGAPPEGIESPAPDNDSGSRFRRRTPETMPEFGDPTNGGEAPMFETGQTNSPVTHSTSRPPTTPLPEAEAGSNEAGSAPETGLTAEDDGTTFLPPVLDDSEDRAAPGTDTTENSDIGQSNSTSQATARPVTNSDEKDSPATGDEQSGPPSDEFSAPKTDASSPEDDEAGNRSLDVRTAFRITPIMLPASRSGANSLLGPRRLAGPSSAQSAVVTTTPQPEKVRTSDSHPSAPQQSIRWISLPLDAGRSLR